MTGHGREAASLWHRRKIAVSKNGEVSCDTGRLEELAFECAHVSEIVSKIQLDDGEILGHK